MKASSIRKKLKLSWLVPNTIVTIGALLVIIPFVGMVLTSLKTPAEIRGFP